MIFLSLCGYSLTSYFVFGQFNPVAKFNRDFAFVESENAFEPLRFG